jgi:hypothetical protein
LSAGQEVRIVLGDNKVGNSVVLKIAYNSPEFYFYALYEESPEGEIEPAMGSGFLPVVKGDKFYLTFEKGFEGIRAWRQTGVGSPTVFTQGTLTEPLEIYGTTADLILQGAGSFRGTNFIAFSLNPEPPIVEKKADKMIVSLQAQNWGGKTVEDIAAAVHNARFDTEDSSVGFLEKLLAAGLKITCLFSGPYNEEGVSALDPDEWVANALAYYEANLTPEQAPIVEVLNEPHGPWFWGEGANSAKNALAYRVIIKKTYEAFHARYGSESPKIIASVEGSGIDFGEKWWEPSAAAYLDGVVVHPYGGHDSEEKEASARGHRDKVEEARLLTGESLPVYVTEVGWPTAIGEEPTGDSLQWTEAEQATNITEFFEWARGQRYVAEVAYFGYHDFGTNTWYGVVDLVGRHKAGYASIERQTGIYDGTFVESRVPIRRHVVPDKLAIRIDAPGGGSARWADDEIRPENVMSGITIEDEMPGGYKQLKGTLARNPQINWPDTGTYGRVKAYLPGVEKVFEGSLDKSPQASGDHLSMRPEMVGDQRLLEDDKSVKFGIIDGDLSKWGAPSTLRRRSLALANYHLIIDMILGFNDASNEWGPGVIFQVDSSGGNTEAGQFLGEAWWYGGGIDVAKLRYDYKQLSPYGEPDFDWIDEPRASQTDDGEFWLGTNHQRQSATNQTLNVTPAGYKYLALLVLREAALGGTFVNIDGFLNPKVIGRHGLAEKGTWPNIGFTAKQIHEYAIPLFASGLVVKPENIEDDGYVIEQAWYEAAGTLAEHIRDYCKYSLYDWFVFDDMEFQYRKPGSYGRQWRINIGDSELEEDGLDGERLWESIVVSFQDVSGRTITVGPPGSGSDVESGLLKVSDPEHPAVLAKRKRRDLLELQGVSNPAQAIEVGVRFLEEANLLPRSGSAKISGFALDSNSVLRPVSQMKSGDYVSFVDAHDNSYRKIVHRLYDHDSRSAEIDFDAPPTGLEQLLERLQGVLNPLGVS